VLIGVLPQLVVGLLNRAIADWLPHAAGIAPSIAAYVPIGRLTCIALALLIAIGLGGLWFSRWRINRPARSAGTWDCGYARPTARMQYTGSSFTQMMIELLAWVVWPRRRAPRITAVFAAPANFASEVPDVVLDRALLPALGSAESSLAWARVIQRGPIQVYILYVLAILILLFLFA
jgi:hypothetical protein